MDTGRPTTAAGPARSPGPAALPDVALPDVDRPDPLASPDGAPSRAAPPSAGGTHRPASPRRRRALLALAATAVVVVAAVAAVVAHLATAGGPAAPGGRVLATTTEGRVVLATTDGSVTGLLPAVPDTGFFAAGDGRYLATGTGQEFVLRGRALTATGDLPFVGAPGSWRALDFTDGDRGLVATEESLVPGSSGVEVVPFAGRHAVRLGDAASVVGDPGALGVFAVVSSPTSGAHAATAPLTDTRVERRDAGRRPVDLIDAPRVVAALGSDPATLVNLSVIPDPRGDRIAVVVVPDGGRPGVGIVVVDRDGHLLGALRADNQDVGRPAWSPDGTRLVYDASTPEEAAVGLWRVGRPPTLIRAPAGVGSGSGFGDCLWSVTGAGFLCADSNSSGPRTDWLVGRDGDAVLRRVLGPTLPFAWLPDGGTAPI